MTDQQAAAGTQDGSGAEPQAGESAESTQVGRQQQSQQAQSQTSERSEQRDEGGEASDTLSREEARKLRNETASLRKRLKELEQKDMTEQERLAATNTELSEEIGTLRTTASTLQQRNVELQAQIALYKAGATRPELIANRMTEDDLADDKSIKAAAERLRKEYPELFGAVVQGNADGATNGSSVTARKSSSMNDMMRARWRPGTQG